MKTKKNKDVKFTISASYKTRAPHLPTKAHLVKKQFIRDRRRTRDFLEEFYEEETQEDIEEKNNE